MKQDYEFIKEILQKMEAHDSPVIQSETLLEKLCFSEETERVKRDKLFIHLQILADNHCIKKSGTMIQSSISPTEIVSTSRTKLDIGFNLTGGYPTPNQDYFRLTKNGYELLASLENNKIMSEVKKTGGKIAIESLIKAGTELGSQLLLKILSPS